MTTPESLFRAAGGTTESFKPNGDKPTDNNPADDDARPPAFTDEALALRFTDQHKHALRYVAAWGRWLIRGPDVWRFDDTLRAFDLSRVVCRHGAAGCNNKKLAHAIAAAKTVAAVERLAKADRRHAATTDQWDADVWLLNTPGGVVDLRTGRMRAHRPDDYMTKITAVAPTPRADCPLWFKFLNEVTQGDADFIRFLQQWCGYSLTGDISEHALLFVYGGGENGKGVFVNTVGDIIGAYREIAAMDTFTATQSDRHPADLAKLRGARMVVVSEVEEGRAWAEARIKLLTGGDRIAARFMRQDFFEYDPQFKLTITGNYKPILRNVDKAARRRINMAPFIYEPPHKDTLLRKKLEPEWPGILRWMIDGCLDWQTNGLIRPPVVAAATAEYFREQDSVQLWIEDCCEITTPHSADTNKSLFASWRNYALSRGENIGTQRWFSGTLQRLHFEQAKDECGIRGRGFKGIRVREFREEYGRQQE